MPNDHWTMTTATVNFEEPVQTIHQTMTQTMYTFAEQVDDLRCQFEALRHDVNTVLLKLQECSRQADLIDDAGDALDEFIESFVVHQ